MELGITISPGMLMDVAAGGGPGGGGDVSGGQVDITISRRSKLQVSPEGFLFEAKIQGFEALGPGVGEIYDERLHDVYYYWDFGDNYTFSAPTNVLAIHKDSGVAFGPIASHTYRAPGTYTVSVLAVEPSSGKQATHTISVTVGNADTLFAGAATLYVAPDGGFSNKPTGAHEFTTFDAAVSAIKSAADDVVPKRIVLKRGQVFTSTGSQLGSSSVRLWPSVHIVAGEAPGAKPIVTMAGGFLWNDMATTGNGNDKDIVFQNINWRGPWDSTREVGSAPTFFLAVNNKPNLILVDQCELSGFGIALYSGASGTLANSDTKIINDTVITNWREYGIFDARNRETAITGSRFTQDVNALSGGDKGQGHNEHGPYRSEEAGKLIIHSSDFFTRNGWFTNAAPYHTEQPCVRFNMNPVEGAQLFAHGNVMEGGGDGVIRVAAQNTSPNYAPKAVNAVIAQNYLLGSYWTGQVVDVHHGGTTIRNNIMVRPDAPAVSSDFELSRFIRLYPHGGDIVNRASSVKIYSNTMVNLLSLANVSGAADAAAVIYEQGATFNNLEVGNNLVHQPNISAPIVVYAPLDDDENLFSSRGRGYRDDVITTQEYFRATRMATLTVSATVSFSAGKTVTSGSASAFILEVQGVTLVLGDMLGAFSANDSLVEVDGSGAGTATANQVDTGVTSTYAPKAGSVAIGAAVNDPVSLDDFFGNLRPLHPSIGALEMQ